MLLIGPTYVTSLFDVVGKAPERVALFSASGVHPTSFLRPLINTALLKRIGFAAEAEAFEEAWRRLYAPTVARRLPPALWSSFPYAAAETVKALCFDRHDAYGGKALADVTRFRRQDVAVAREAGERLATGANPGNRARAVPDLRRARCPGAQAGPSGADRGKFLRRPHRKMSMALFPDTQGTIDEAKALQSEIGAYLDDSARLREAFSDRELVQVVEQMEAEQINWPALGSSVRRRISQMLGSPGPPADRDGFR